MGLTDKIAMEIEKKLTPKIFKIVQDAQKNQLEKNNKKMTDIIDKFEKSTRDTVKQIINEEFEAKIAKVVKNEMSTMR